MTATVSACIIALNEEERLPACLDSLTFCDEVIVVDAGSTDGTRDVARDAGATVVEHSWRGFGAQRNIGLDHARGEWVLEVDADERVSPKLRSELERFLADSPAGIGMAGLPIRDLFLGRPLGPSSKYPKYRHRLFRRGEYRHDEARTVHEGLVPHGAVHPFEGELLHILAADLGEALWDTWAYARLEAGQLAAHRSPAAYMRGLLLRPLAKLGYRLVVDGGWRDGWRGLLKVSLECASDALVWARYMARRQGTARGRSGAPPDDHFGRLGARLGPVRLVGCATGEDAAERAAGWLREAAASGADVTLVSDVVPAATPPPRVRLTEGSSTLACIRALTAEEELRAIDALVPFGKAARRRLRMAPPSLCGATAPVSEHTDAHAAVVEVHRATRPS